MQYQVAFLYAPLVLFIVGGALHLASLLGAAVGLEGYGTLVFIVPLLLVCSAAFFVPLYAVQRKHGAERPYRLRDTLTAGYYGAARLTARGKRDTYAFVAAYFAIAPLVIFELLPGASIAGAFAAVPEVTWLLTSIVAAHILFCSIQVIRYSRRAREEPEIPEANLRSDRS